MNHEIPGTIYQPANNTVTVVEMYFNTCPYCDDNAPNVDALAEQYGGSPRVQVVDVGIDRNDSSYQSWISRHNPNHPVLKDDQRKVANALGTTSYPSTYVLDCEGNVLYKSVGVWTKAIKQKIQDAIEKSFEVACLQE